MNNTDHRLITEGRDTISTNLIGSPLAAAGMQARNFTATVREAVPGIAPDFYATDSLASDIERLCDPADVPSDELFLNVAVKYFFAYVHDGAQDDRVPYGEIASLYEQFSRHHSLNEPADDIEIMNRLRQWSPVLKVLADAARAAHVMRAVVGQRDVSIGGVGPYVGVDLGAGTGIMLLAQQIQARRNGFCDVQTFGFQADMMAGERTHDLIRALGAGSLILADPTRPGAYGMLRGRPIVYVANEMVAGIQQSLCMDNFFNKYKAFYASIGHGADEAAFFPEGLIAYSRTDNASVILAKENRYQAPLDDMNSEFIPQGLIMEGKIVPMHRLGGDFNRYLT